MSSNFKIFFDRGEEDHSNSVTPSSFNERLRPSAKGARERLRHCSLSSQFSVKISQFLTAADLFLILAKALL